MFPYLGRFTDLGPWWFAVAVALLDVIAIGRALLRILRFHAHDLNLVPSVTAYRRLGKGPEQPLRFTKTGDRNLEEAYARHFVWPGDGPFHPPATRPKPDRSRGGAPTPEETR